MLVWVEEGMPLCLNREAWREERTMWCYRGLAGASLYRPSISMITMFQC